MSGDEMIRVAEARLQQVLRGDAELLSLEQVERQLGFDPEGPKE